ncbi:NAD(P)H-binding protein [Glycomyces sp. NPDC047369]
MKLTVLGATGRTGREVLRQAVNAGHEVTAVVRDAARLPADLRRRTTTVVAELDDLQALTDSVAGRDAVINAVGPRDLRAPTNACADSTRAAIAAVTAAGADARIVLASNSAMHPGPGDDPMTRYFVKPVILARALKHLNADAAEAERLLRASAAKWVIVRAGRLSDGPGKDRYRSAADRNVTGGFQITRADFAKALLDAAADPTSERRAIAVAN